MALHGRYRISSGHRGPLYCCIVDRCRSALRRRAALILACCSQTSARERSSHVCAQPLNQLLRARPLLWIHLGACLKELARYAGAVGWQDHGAAAGRRTAGAGDGADISANLQQGNMPLSAHSLYLRSKQHSDHKRCCGVRTCCWRLAAKGTHSVMSTPLTSSHTSTPKLQISAFTLARERPST